MWAMQRRAVDSINRSARKMLEKLFFFMGVQKREFLASQCITHSWAHNVIILGHVHWGGTLKNSSFLMLALNTHYIQFSSASSSVLEAADGHCLLNSVRTSGLKCWNVNLWALETICENIDLYVDEVRDHFAWFFSNEILEYESWKKLKYWKSYDFSSLNGWLSCQSSFVYYDVRLWF